MRSVVVVLTVFLLSIAVVSPALADFDDDSGNDSTSAPGSCIAVNNQTGGMLGVKVVKPEGYADNRWVIPVTVEGQMYIRLKTATDTMVALQSKTGEFEIRWEPFGGSRVKYIAMWDYNPSMMLDGQCSGGTWVIRIKRL